MSKRTDKHKAPMAVPLEQREAFFYRQFHVVLDEKNKDLTGISAGRHIMLFTTDMAEALAIHLLRVTQLQREMQRTGDYRRMQERLQAIQFNADEIERQGKSYSIAEEESAQRED